MNFPERFSDLPAYAFPRLRALLDHHKPGGDVIHMTIGEPKHAFPAWVADVIMENAAGFQGYPPNEGSPDLARGHFWLDQPTLWRRDGPRHQYHGPQRHARGAV